MKAKHFFVGLFLLFFINSLAQNLVINGDFETYSSCPSVNGFGIGQATPWLSATARSPDYFNVCSAFAQFSVPFNCDSSLGYQWPHSGNGYAGFNLFLLNNSYIRAYAQISLTDTLKFGHYYCLRFYVNLWNGSKYGIDAIGANLSSFPVTCTTFNCLINAPTQVSNPTGNIIIDTLAWTKIEGCFIAQGGEKYLTIGNFKTDSLTQIALNRPFFDWSSFYYLDDVSLYEDTTLSIKESTAENYFSVNPNPCDTYCYLQFLNSDLLLKLIITDLSGMQIKEVDANKNAINVSELANGVYLLKCTFESGKSTTRKIIIAHN